MVMEMIGDHGLPAFVDLNVPNRLLARLVQLDQGFHGGAGRCLRLQGQPTIPFHGSRILSRILGHAPGHFGKDHIKGGCLGSEHSTNKIQLPLFGFILPFAHRLGEIAQSYLCDDRAKVTR